MTYTLTLTAPDGTTTAGSLDIELAKTDKLQGADLAAIAAATESETTVAVIPIKGQVTIDGVGSAQLEGVDYCTLLGPPITNILTGTLNGEYVGVQCNVIDSPGVYMGGSVLLGQKPYGLLGQR